ncbi:D-alanyl-D-alanine carboxypeptidase family protein [Streptomyces sp. NPDC008139]|uniref:D-alanyl-D-alanine carboxypeptidase family protein n=1 Tax=Streptomyces sp. NPDC008139 TaxID=3364814 RepID=UPI0036E52EF2
MNVFRASSCRHDRPRKTAAPAVCAVAASVAAARCLAIGCCLAAATALATVSAAATAPAAALPGDGGRGSSGPGAATVVAGGPLLAGHGVLVQPHAGSPRLPSGLSALSWTVSDARTGQVLAAKDPHRRLPPASTLKTLFAVTVLPRFPGDATHRVTDSDLAGIGAGSSLVGIQARQTYTVADLWRGVFLSSGNDAVHVLAHMNGSVPLTVSQMQAKAEMLGADDTHVVSPDGYDMPGQVSSAYDLAVIARAGLAMPDFATYASTRWAQFPGGYDAHGKYVKSFGIQNTNRLLTGADGVKRYPGVIGVKNGYTTNAGNTLVAAAKRGDRTLIATVMNPQSGLPQAVYHEAGALLDWGFSAAGRTSSVGTLNTATTAYHDDSAHASEEAERPAPQPAQEPARQEPKPAPAPHAPSTADAASSSPTTWYVGGALALGAAGSVVVLRRRYAAKAR